MATLHIIGIGGTGHKLSAAVVHLAACGAFKGSFGGTEIKSIRIAAVDADDSNGNLNETKNTVNAYNKFYNAVNSARELNLVPIEQLINIKLYRDGQESINDAFNVPQYNGADTDKLIRFLYTKEEIETRFNQGFYGHTSIGTLIVRDILNNDEKWTGFKDRISGGDFVFVLGSIFGGTGASAIPVVLDELKQIKKNTESLKYALLMLTPYFNAVGVIKEEGELQPDSGNFHLKAKAALYYYREQHQFENVDAVYVIGEPQQNFSIEEASRGSANQKNKAHPLELFAVSSMIDFIKGGDGRYNHKIITADREADGSECFYTWNMIRKIDSGLPSKIQNFIKVCIFYNKILYAQLKKDDAAGAWESKYDKELRTEKDDSEKFVYESVREYTKRFVEWFYDIHKRNLNEINQSTGRLKWLPDKRVKLFNAEYAQLFDSAVVSGDKIENFDELVFDDDNPKKTNKIYAELCGKSPGKDAGKRMAGLFANLYGIIKKEEHGFFGRKKIIPKSYSFIPYLSKENNTTFVRGNSDPEHLWVEAEPELLTNIADGLPFVLSDKFTVNDISIPSPWSIFVVNELTLTEKKFDSLNKESYKKWCAFITLIALRKLRRYGNDGLELKQLETGADKFVDTVVSTCIPYTNIFDNPNWGVQYALSLDGKVIAFLAINTLTCPAYFFSGETLDKLHRIAPSIVSEKREFLTPDNYFANQSQSVNREAKYALVLFLKALKSLLTEQAQKGNKRPIIKSLQDLTDRFVSDLGKTDVYPGVEPPVASRPVASVYDVFELLAVKSGAEVEKPFVLQRTMQNFKAALIGFNICGISSSSPQAASIFVTDNLKYNQISTPETLRSKSGAIDGGYLLVHDDELLLDSTVLISRDNDEAVFYSMAGKANIQNAEIIWPLSDKLLELYDIPTLNDMVSASEDAESVTVTLELEVKKGKHTVTKKYKKIKNQGDTQNTFGTCTYFDRQDLPLWAVWPYSKVMDVSGNNNTWQRYNFFCIERIQKGTARVLEVEPVFTAGNTMPNEQKLSTISTVQRNKYYRRYKALPGALKLKIKNDSQSPSLFCGLVFLKEPRHCQHSTVEWNIGLDFGTTSTTAFYTARGESTPNFLRLISEYIWKEGESAPVIPENRKVQNALAVLCNSGGYDKSEQEHYFIDEQCLAQNSYITTYEIMDTSNPSKDNTIFETGRIFWHNWDNFRTFDKLEGRRDNLRTNIKWDGDRSVLGKFLNQLMTQMVYAAAERGVRKINWFFSYPTAYGPEAKTDFTEKLKTITKNLADDTGVAIVFGQDHLITESIAAAYYFREKNKFQQLFLCVDIGGGTSDISVWVHDNNLFQTSVRLASRDMFIEPLKKLLSSGSVMDEVRTSNNDDGIYTMLHIMDGGNSNSLEQIKYFIETVLFEYYDKFKNRLNLLEGENKKFFKNFKAMVLIAYSGLCYYLANIIGSLFETGKIDNDITEIVFGLSGKGSKLTNWIDAFCPIIYEETQNLIASKKQKEKSIKIKPQFDSDSAKTETAKGLICNLDASGERQSKDESAEAEVYIGGSVTLTKDGETKLYNSNEIIAVYKDDFLKKPELLQIEFGHELEDFDAFLEFFNRIAGKTRGDMDEVPVDWYKKNKKNLWNRMKTAFEKTCHEEKRFDPPFIVMLKVFLNYYSEEYLYAEKK